MSDGNNTNGDDVSAVKVSEELLQALRSQLAEKEAELKRVNGELSGLRGYTNKLKTDHDQAVAELSTVRTELESVRTAYQTETEALKAASSGYKTQLEEAQKTIEQSAKEKAFQSSIKTEYPELQIELEKGLLNHLVDADDEARRTYLENMRAIKVETKTNVASTQNSGSTVQLNTGGSGSPAGSGEDADTLWNKLMGGGLSDAEYQKVYTAYEALTSK
ncbi:MAG: hypothetical protein HC892_00270 [Saprospiraceae bacterium]|nr:hypothetical protein [Saprospiraceae bacterium]